MTYHCPLQLMPSRNCASKIQSTALTPGTTGTNISKPKRHPRQATETRLFQCQTPSAHNLLGTSPPSRTDIITEPTSTTQDGTHPRPQNTMHHEGGATGTSVRRLIGRPGRIRIRIPLLIVADMRGHRRSDCPGARARDIPNRRGHINVPHHRPDGGLRKIETGNTATMNDIAALRQQRQATVLGPR